MAHDTKDLTGSWKFSRRVAWRKVADEAIILEVESASYYSLSGAGLRMWELLGKGKSAVEIGKALAKEYDASEEKLSDDCADLVCRLRKERLIERAA
jgi:hypothetical protein